MSDLLRKHLHGTIKQIDRTKREITALLTHQVVDADGEVVMASGVDWSRWRHNAPMLYQHDRERKVGNWDPGSLRLTTIDGAPGWTATGRLFSTGALADQVYQELQEGSTGVSIGFQAKQADLDPAVRGQTGRTFREITVVEASLVTLQSCPTCVVLEKSARGAGGSELIEIVDDRNQLVEVADVVAAVRTVRERQARGLLGRGDEPIVFEDEPDTEETFLVDPEAVRAAVASFGVEHARHLQMMVDREVTRAVNYLRGRVD
jgi:hypothetical protein